MALFLVAKTSYAHHDCSMSGTRGDNYYVILDNYFPEKFKNYTQLETGLCRQADSSFSLFVILTGSTAWCNIAS